MYVVIVYDVAVGRIDNVRKYLKQYLNWVQNSALEGELTRAELRKIRHRLSELIDEEQDSILIYAARSDKFIKKEVLGVEKGETDVII
ncbi:MAG: CRISPR-associated endonuclease Cas2 [Candidatus Thermoplasmatota archaeon]|nr:CRISPR-associated endonuclease Cas2 [Candidatus Thermoplasmatota archaeon]